MSKTETQSEAQKLSALLNVAMAFDHGRIGTDRRFVEMDAPVVASVDAELRRLDAENKALRELLDASPAASGQGQWMQRVGAEVAAYAVGTARVERVAQSRGGFKWAVREFGEVLNLGGEWESEPSPSARDDAFLLRCRFDTAQQAIDACIAAQAAAKTGDAA